MNYRKIGECVFVIKEEKFYIIDTFPMKIFYLDVTSWEEAIEVAQEYSLERESIESERSKSFEKFISIDWLITNECNLNCTHCFAKKHGEFGRYGIEQKAMSIEEIQKSIDISLKILDGSLSGKSDYARVELFIVGGEPLLEKQLIKDGIKLLDEELEEFRIAHNLKEIDRQVMIVSNGILVDEDFASFVADKNISMTVSIDAPGYSQKVDENGYNFTPKVIKNLHLLLDKGCKEVSVNFVIPPDKLHDTDIVFEYLQRNNLLEKLHTVQMSPQIPPHRQTQFCGCKPSEVIISDFGSSVEKCELFAEKMLGYNKKYGMDIKDYNHKMHFLIQEGGMAYRCPAAQWKTCTIPGGDIYPCHQLINIEGFKMGNVLEGIDNSEKCNKVQDIFHNRLVFNVEPCKDCPMQTVCITFVDCPARCYLECGNINKVPQHYCTIAKKYLESIFLNYIKSLNR